MTGPAGSPSSAPRCGPSPALLALMFATADAMSLAQPRAKVAHQAASWTSGSHGHGECFLDKKE